MIIFFFFIFIFIAIIANNKKSFNVDFRKIIIILLIVIGIPLIFSIVISKMVKSSDTTTVADGFTIEGYEVILDVLTDNKVNVTENIDINFYEGGHHGIYKFTPLWLEYTGKDNKTIKRKANISNYVAVNDNYTVDTVNKKERIKIGDPYTYVEGKHLYTIKYTYDMGKDPFNGFDEFIFHAFGDFWGTRIKNPKIIVNLPKGIDGNIINVFTDKYRKTNVNNLVDTVVENNKVTITGKDNFMLYNSLTIDIELPENYFVGGSLNYGLGSFVITMITLGITGIIFFMWSKYGKNFEKRIPTVEFYAPDNLNSAEIGYIYNRRQANKKLTISLIVSLASKGYIKINEIKDTNGKSKIEIINLLVKPKEVNESDLKMPTRTITVKKLKDIDDNLNQSEITMMIHMFKKDNVKVLTSNIDRFLSVKDRLVNDGYIEIIRDNEEKIRKEVEEKQHKFDELYMEYYQKQKEYENKKESLPEIKGMESAIYHRLFESKDVIILSEHKTFYHSFSEVSNDLEDRFKKKVVDENAAKKRSTTIILAIVSLYLSIISFFIVEDLDPSMSILYYLSFACFIVDLFFAIIMGRKTDYGEIVYARVLGFRNFLLTAEKEKLESLVLENPHYFYDILPYTYVLNISKKWINKFEDIPMPEVDMGNFTYLDGDSSFSSIYDSVYFPVTTSSSSSSSSGCSSCGGGCSSCGGGCSSCGGGGSW